MSAGAPARRSQNGMAEKGNQNHPVRTLVVKHFPPIREARLRFGKITVLIGPQASGKSLLYKLAFFLGGEIPEIAVESLLNGDSWNDFTATATVAFSSRFSPANWLRKDSVATLSSGHYFAEIRGNADPLKPSLQISFSEDFKKLYSAIIRNHSNEQSYSGASRSELRQDLWIKINMLLDPKLNQGVIYVPFGRSLFTDPARLVSALQNPDLDWITRRFAGQVIWDQKWKVGLLTTGRDTLQGIQKEMAKLVGGEVSVRGGTPRFTSVEGRELPLDRLSSGTLEMLPMFALFTYLAFNQEHYSARTANTKISPRADIIEYSPLIYLEEPETAIFPKTQYDIVKLLAWFANDPVLSFDWCITTHSPYVLSSFNNLLQAWQVASSKPASVKRKVQRLIGEQYWIAPRCFEAYCINNGELESIMDSETGLIDGTYLDSVSSEIGAQFDELLRIDYAKA